MSEKIRREEIEAALRGKVAPEEALTPEQIEKLSVCVDPVKEYPIRSGGELTQK